MKKYISVIGLMLVVMITAAQDHVVTKQDYERAESLLSSNTQQYVDYGSVSPNWFDGDKFWYRNLIPNGSEFIVVDPARKSRKKK